MNEEAEAQGEEVTRGRTRPGCLAPGSMLLTWASKSWSISSLRSICQYHKNGVPVLPLESPSHLHPSKGSRSEQVVRSQQWMVMPRAVWGSGKQLVVGGLLEEERLSPPNKSYCF